MKMSPTLFASLEADCVTICETLDMQPANFYEAGTVWDIFHKIMRDRTYSNDHPGYVSGKWTRALPQTFESGNSFLDQFYKVEDLDDSHIATALRRIFPNCPVQ